ncbi:hypothetical protein GTR02_11615 [Kineococcus sp. R8]|uniref:hypothetical protein n=1 Tax=Kineococcus siccus TaxID=2696567 RepID=UPI00141369F0|nr:hypothetical protein [Kineococcus siccus]NAZ82468.1 hypothetical protein [Kineococcus siccus]
MPDAPVFRLLHRTPHYDRLRLMSDYHAPTPVWAPAELGGYVLRDLQQLGVEDALCRELLAWQHYFDEHHPLDLCAWDSPRSEETYAHDGHRLHDWLRASLPGVRVDLDLWPVPADGDEPG